MIVCLFVLFVFLLSYFVYTCTGLHKRFNFISIQNTHKTNNKNKTTQTISFQMSQMFSFAHKVSIFFTNASSWRMESCTIFHLVCLFSKHSQQPFLNLKSDGNSLSVWCQAQAPNFPGCCWICVQGRSRGFAPVGNLIPDKGTIEALGQDIGMLSF